MKKTVLFLLTFLLPIVASAYDAYIDGIYYNLDQTAKTAEVTWRGLNDSNKNAYTGTLNIPSKINYNGEDFTVTSIAREAFKRCPNLVSITIPNSMKYIGGNAFDETGWYNNQPNGILYLDNWIIDYKGEKPTGSISIAEGTRGIAEFAFYCGSYLTNITIPNSVMYIGTRAFDGCSSLTSVNIPNGVTCIKAGTFFGCSSLTAVTIPNSVTVIENSELGYGAFGRCSGLTSVTFGNSLKEIGSEAFEGCTSLVSITIPNSVTNIGYYSFGGCSSLTSVTIPSSVTNIGYYAFEGCRNLTSVHISDIEAWCKISFSGEESNPLLYAHHLYLGEEDIKDIVIPNSITNLGNYTFNGCSGLTSVTIPNSVTNIGEFAFSGCSGLTSVTIPSSVTSIGNSAFYGCSGLTFTAIPNSVTNIGNSAFSNCNGMISITIPNSVMVIGENAFLNCSKVETLKLPDELHIIRKATFKGCNSLKPVTIPPTVEFIYQEAFANCNNLESVKAMPEAPPFLYDNSFSNYNILLYAPATAVETYMITNPWSKFTQFLTLDGTELETEQCAPPTITYNNGKLSFSCETESVTYLYRISTPSSIESEGDEVNLSTKYTITVIAKKDGYLDSDPVTQEIDVRGMEGDMNGDGKVSITDAVTIVNVILGISQESQNP